MHLIVGGKQQRKFLHFPTQQSLSATQLLSPVWQQTLFSQDNKYVPWQHSDAAEQACPNGLQH